ncbi:MAG: DNA primase [Minicystis sp.]
MISAETIAQVKERTDLTALVGETVKLTRRGRSFTGLCPFHKEKTPSFHVNAERGFFHCFGCKESGGPIDFIMKIEGRTFPEAVRMLAERAGITIEETLTDVERREATAARRAKDDLYAVNNLAATFFERSLIATPHPLAHYARAELARRALALSDTGQGNDQVGEAARVADTLQAFRIGYAPFGWDGLAAFLKQQGISPIVGERVGLLVPRTSGTGHYDRFRHRLMFAVIDVLGRVIAFSGRALPDPTPAELSDLKLSGPAPQADNAPAKYINSPESPIYTKGEHLFGLHQARQSVRQSGESILVEGNFDVVALHARGINNVVAPLGTAFTTAQAKLLKRFAPTVTVLFDGDNAGRKATRASRASCREGGLSAKVASLPTGVDPDDFVRKNGAEGLTRLLKSARGMLEYLIDDALDGGNFGGSSLSEQLARVRAVADLLSTEDDPALRTMAKTYADRLSSKLVVMGRSPTDLHQLERIMEQATSGAKRSVPLASQSAERGDRARSRAQVDSIPQAMLGALLDFPDLLDDPEAEESLGFLDGDAALAVAAMRQHLIAAPHEDAIIEPSEADAPPRQTANKGLYADEFLAQIPRPIHSFAVGRLASPQFEQIADAKFELLENARKLKRLSLTRENAAGVDQLHRAEAQGDVDAEMALLREIDLSNRKKRGLV